MPRRFLLLAFCLLPLSAFAQFGSNTARRVVSGTAAPPANCNAGPVDMYARTGATSPGFYVCLATNTWTGPITTGGGLPAHLTYSDPTLTVSAATFGNGQVAMSGNTSGTATLTAPAVAGTSTNPITVSNIFQGPNGSGTNPTYSFTSATSTGLYFDGSALGLESGGSEAQQIFSTGTLFLQPIRFGQGILLSPTSPTISSGFGTSPSVVSPNGTGAFTINVGTGGAASTGVIGLPAAPHGWNCTCTDITTQTTTTFYCKQTGAGTTTTAPIGEFTTAGAAGVWTASDILTVSCFAY
jgi:hypothetical protein